jgi:drug/metabolite transporter (DMT)-like permease
MEGGKRWLPNWGGVVAGTMLILFGVMLTLRNIDIVQWSIMRHFWPFIPIGIGLTKLLQPPRHGRRREGALVLFGGVWLLLNDLQVLRYRESWPLLLIGWGIAIAWDAVAARERKAE